MSGSVATEVLDVLFRKARSFSSWLNKPISDEILVELYELVKFGPTSLNGCPMRVTFLRTQEAKERLKPALLPANVPKMMGAPVTAIIAYDLRFYELFGKLFPTRPNAGDAFAKNPELAEVSAFRNGTLQGGYFILAARALGLDCGPMSGFDNAKVDEEFFGAGAQTGSDQEFLPGRLKSNFLCNLGYGDPSGLYPRLPRLDFKDACQLL